LQDGNAELTWSGDVEGDGEGVLVTVFSYVLSLVFLFFLLSGFLLRLFCCGVFLTSSGSETKTMAMKT